MNRAATILGLLGGLVSLCGCVHLPAKCSRPAPPPLPEAIKARFARPDSQSVAVQEVRREVHRRYRAEAIELTIAPGSTNGDYQLQFDFYHANREPSPAILLLPMAGGGYQIERKFAKYFVSHGFAVVIAHRRKVPHEEKLEAIGPWLEQSVRDARYVLDWMETRPELDTNRIALFGISTGGIRGVMLTAVDARIKAAALGLTGGDLPYILTHSAEHNIARRRKAILRERNLTPAQLQIELRKIIPYDPNALAPYVDCRKVLLVLAACDSVVPFRTGWELRAKLGKPATLLLPTGHYTAALAIPWIERASLRFFRKQLSIAPFAGPTQRLRSPRDTGSER